MLRFATVAMMGLLAGALLLSAGCRSTCRSQCDSCGADRGWFHRGGGECGDCGGSCGGWFKRGCGGSCAAKLAGHSRSNAIPEIYPLGSVLRAHTHAMQTNAEATDFVFFRHEFVGETGELTPDGKDHVLEVAARMRSAPFPVVIERSENNANPELDAHRRGLIAQMLTDFGNPDAPQRTFVSPAYGPGQSSVTAEQSYYQTIWLGNGTSTFNNFGATNSMNSFGGGGVGFGP